MDKDFSEIFYAASLYRNISIVSDDTVSGHGTFRFAGDDFDSAFDSFLRASRLYVSKKSDVWTVSRLSLENKNGRYYLDACDVKADRLLEKLSEYFAAAITFDSLPAQEISLHANSESLNGLLEIIVKQLGNEYVCQFTKENPHIQHLQKILSNDTSSFGKMQIEANEASSELLFNLDIEGAAAGRVLEEIFNRANKNFIFTCDSSNLVRRLLVENKSLKECLDLVCSCSALEWIECEGLFYIREESEKNKSALDAGKVWCRHDFLYFPAEKAMAVLSQRFGQLPFILLEKENALLCFARSEIQDEMKDFEKSFDVKSDVKYVSLQYIKVDELLSRLPPGIEVSQIKLGTQDNSFFFTGTSGQYSMLLESIKLLDVNAKRIRYDLLVMQYQSSDSFTFDHTLSSKRLALGDRNGMTAVLGSVLNLNMDVVGAFGMKFASALQTAINENHAKVYADTTLQGLSGTTISFKNTNTYRYRDNNLDPETGKPVYSGVTREIVSGLTIDITGWVSGDGMITSKVTASVSRQGADLSSSTGNPPPTSEKIITTEVLGKSGEPLVLSGLMQNDEELVEERTPFLSKIPIIGWFFKSHKKTKERSEMVIYLVPRWEDGTNENLDIKGEDFEKFSQEFLKEKK